MLRIEPVRLGLLICGGTALLAGGLVTLVDRGASRTEGRATAPVTVATRVGATADETSDLPACTCTQAPDVAETPRERIALQRACDDAAKQAATDGDDETFCGAPWSRFATLPDAVILARSTGACGGCGALTHATVFRGDEAIASGVLGKFGRFGNGADAASWIDAGPTRVLALDASESMGGYLDAYRSLYVVEHGALSAGTCVVTKYSNTGAVEPGEELEWTAGFHLRRSGALDLTYRITRRGEKAPKRLPPPVHLSAKRVRTAVDECIEPDGMPL